MSDQSTIHGSCHCGAINIAIPKPDSLVLCHCISCKKSGGTTASANFTVETNSMKLEGSKPKQYKCIGTSGNEVIRNFCGECGSPLWTAVADPSKVFVKAGLFDPQVIPPPTSHLFAKDMSDWEIVHEGASRLDTQ